MRDTRQKHALLSSTWDSQQEIKLQDAKSPVPVLTDGPRVDQSQPSLVQFQVQV